MIRVVIAALVITVICFLACSDDPSGPGSGVNGADLMGLTDDHTLEYLQIDSTITYVIDTTISPYPIRHVQVSTQVEVISIIQDDSDWLVRDGSQPILNLKVSGPYVLNNGYYRHTGGIDSLIYYQIPVILMPNDLKQEVPWTSTIEKYIINGDSLSFPFYYAYFGYHFSKSFVDLEEVLVPAGAYNAYRFDVNLFSHPTDTIATASATEHYATGVGLVKLRFEDSGFIRTLTLRNAF